MNHSKEACGYIRDLNIANEKIPAYTRISPSSEVIQLGSFIDGDQGCPAASRLLGPAIASCLRRCSTDRNRVLALCGRLLCNKNIYLWVFDGDSLRRGAYGRYFRLPRGKFAEHPQKWTQQQRNRFLSFYLILESKAQGHAAHCLSELSRMISTSVR